MSREPSAILTKCELSEVGPTLAAGTRAELYVVLDGNQLVAFQRLLVNPSNKMGSASCKRGVCEHYNEVKSKTLSNVETMTLHKAIDTANIWLKTFAHKYV